MIIQTVIFVKPYAEIEAGVEFTARDLLGSVRPCRATRAK